MLLIPCLKLETFQRIPALTVLHASQWIGLVVCRDIQHIPHQFLVLRCNVICIRPVLDMDRIYRASKIPRVSYCIYSFNRVWHRFKLIIYKLVFFPKASCIGQPFQLSKHNFNKWHTGIITPIRQHNHTSIGYQLIARTDSLNHWSALIILNYATFVTFTKSQGTSMILRFPNVQRPNW